MRPTREATPTPDELRRAAAYLEETSLDDIAGFADIAFPLVSGDLKEFGRPSPEARAAQQGFDVLREDLERTAASLYALAAVLETDRDVPTVLLLRVQPYIDAFRAARDDTKGGRDEVSTNADGDTGGTQATSS